MEADNLGQVLDERTKNKLESVAGGAAKYSWRTGNQFHRGYSSGGDGPTIEFEIDESPANGEVIGHIWLPDGVNGEPHKKDDEITLILKDNHGKDARNEFQYKIRIPFNNDDDGSLFLKEYQHHDYEEIEGIEYKSRPVAKGGSTMGVKATWQDTPNGVRITLWVDEGEPVLDPSGAPVKNTNGEIMRDSWRASTDISAHQDKKWGKEETLSDLFYDGNPTNNWKLVFDHEDTEKDRNKHKPYKGKSGVQTAFRIDAKGKGDVDDKTHRNRPILYGALVREIFPVG